MERKRIIFSLVLFLFSLNLIAGYDVNHYKAVSDTAWGFFYTSPEFGDVIMGGGYIPSIDFEYTLSLYNENLKKNPSPFYYFAIGEVYHFYKKPDSSEYFYKKSISTLNNFYFSLYLYQLFSQPVRSVYRDACFDKLISLSVFTGGTRFPALSVNEEYYVSAMHRGGKNAYFYALDKAILLDKYNPRLYGIRRNESLKRGNIVGFFNDWMQGMSAWFKLFSNTQIWIYNIIRYLWIIFSLFVIIFVLHLFIKYIRFIPAFMEYKFPKFYKKRFGKLFLFTLISLPYIYMLPFIVLVFYSLILVSIFINKKERYISYAIFVFFISLLPLSVIFWNKTEKTLAPNSIVSVVEESVYSSYDTHLVNKIDYLLNTPINSNEKFALLWSKALLFKRKGDFWISESLYKECLDIKGDARIYNNLGNLAFLNEKYKEAAQYYGKSIELNDKRASIYYNLSQLYFKALKMAEGERYLQQAMKINNQLINSFTAHSATIHWNTRFIDDVPSNSDLRSIYIQKGLEYDSAYFIWGMSVKMMLIISFIGIILLFSLRRIYPGEYKICTTCGKILFRRYNVKEFSEFTVCEECFKKIDKGNTDAYKFNLYERLFKRYLRQRTKNTKYLSLIFPGIMHIRNNQKKLGYTLIVFTGLTISWLINLHYRIWPTPYINVSNEYFADFGKMVTMIMISLLYIISFFSIKPVRR